MPIEVTSSSQDPLAPQPASADLAKQSQRIPSITNAAKKRSFLKKQERTTPVPDQTQFWPGCIFFFPYYL